MDPMAEIRETFFLECEELLEALDTGLNELSDGTADSEAVNAIFRAVHSIKGGAGAFGFEDLVRFSHKYETTLDEVRSGNLDVTDDVLKIFFRAADILCDLVAGARDDTEVSKDAVDTVLGHLIALRKGSGGAQEAAPAPAEEAPAFVPMALDFGGLDGDGEAESAPAGEPGFVIDFTPTAELYRSGNEPRILLSLLEEMGECEISCKYDDLPALDDLDPAQTYMTWHIELRTEQSEEDLHDVFDFVEDVSDLKIRPLGNLSEAEAAPLPLASLALDDDDDELDMKAEIEAIGFAPLALALPDAEDGEAEAALVPDQPAEASAPEEVDAAAPEAAAPAAPAPEAAVPVPAAPTPEPAKEEKKAPARSSAPSAPKQTVRVDLERVDRLINLVGELVINQAMLSEWIEQPNTSDMADVESGLDEFKQLTREIQESVMAIRAQPVKPLFQRMARIVREAGDATGKNVRLETFGEGTEVDKTVIERLSDPLTHMIRNAVDHGLESTEKRVAAGKSETGTVRLTAAHRSGRVMIEITDDGAGINRPRVKQIAIDKGLISPEAELSDSEIDNLLFMPGFSTASKVSDLSGRGVGMDVVKQSVMALGGRISISSRPGEGSTFTISLPLTLAVLDGMIIRVADQTMVLPLSAIVETMKPQPGWLHEVLGGSTVVRVRDKFIPVVDVGEKLGYRKGLKSFEDRVIVLIETDGGVLSALAVDGITDQRQVVIKGLEENYGYIPGVAAATILGDGSIALILDPDSLVSPAAAGGEADNQMTAGVAYA